MVAGGRRLELNLFSHIQGVVHLNPEISGRAFQFVITEEKLDRTQVSDLAIKFGQPSCGASSACRKILTLSRCFEPSAAPAGHTDGLKCEDWHEFELGRGIGSQWPAVLGATLQLNF
jgi:hypothetical protein